MIGLAKLFLKPVIAAAEALIKPFQLIPETMDLVSGIPWYIQIPFLILSIIFIFYGTPRL